MRSTAVMLMVPLDVLVNVTICDVEFVETTVLGNAKGDGVAVAV